MNPCFAHLRIARLATVLVAAALGTGSAMAQYATDSLEREPGQPAAASNQTTAGNSSGALLTLPGSHGCPVQMHAMQRGGLQIVRSHESAGQPAPSGHSQPDNTPAQHLHLTLSRGESDAQMTRVRLTVRGTSDKSRALSTGTRSTLNRPGDNRPGEIRPHDISDMRRELDLPVSRDDDQAMAAILVLRGFTSVQSIRIDALIYGDGSIWTPAAGSSCLVAPDPLVLVNAAMR